MRVRESVLIHAPRERVWELLADPSRYPAVLDWVTSFDPRDPDAEPGLGARYDMRVRVGSADVGGLVEVVEYEPGCDIGWTSITGLDHRGRLRLRSGPEDSTRLTMRISYDAPGTILGTLAEILSERQVRASIARSLQRVRCEAEGREPPPPEQPGLAGRLVHEAVNASILARSGLVAPMRPDRLARLALAGVRWGASPATGLIAGAIRHPGRTMLIDELGPLTYGQVDRRTSALARGLAAEGLSAGDRVGLMCRDHRGFVEGLMAASKLGVHVLLLNTSFAGPQLAEVCAREDVAALIHDEEFSELLDNVPAEVRRIIAWCDRDAGERRSLESLREGRAEDPVAPPPDTAHVTILTSGTTGTPKGATRSSAPLTLDPAAALLDRIPLRQGEVMRCAAPLFHAWGLATFVLGLALGDTFVLRRRFDPEACLREIEEHRCQVLVVVPVMLQRILALPEQARRSHDTSSLRAVCSSGSALPGDLANRWMDEFGECLYNMYGSTEVATATLATPADMRAAPGTAGRPARGSVVRLYDADGLPVPQGETGRIFVGNALGFEGYTGGEDKQRIDGLVASGDVGRFDEAGRLFVQGRDDEMIVSGGENVFPKEVEDALSHHPAVAEAAAVGVEDEQFGQRLRAFVVLRHGEQAEEDELKRHVREQLARYKVPREIVFIDEMPRNPTGKILKRRLMELAGDPDGSG